MSKAAADKGIIVTNTPNVLSEDTGGYDHRLADRCIAEIC